MNTRMYCLLACLLYLSSCSTEKNNDATQQQAQAYLDGYNKEYQKLYYASSLAQWKLNTRIEKGDTITQKLADEADKAMAVFTGSIANIDSAKKYPVLAQV